MLQNFLAGSTLGLKAEKMTKWPKLTEAQREETYIAWCKDAFSMALLLLVLMRASRLLEECDTLPATPRELLTATTALVCITIVLFWHIILMPTPLESDASWGAFDLMGHVGTMSVQTVYLQFAYFALNLLALFTGDAQLLTMVYRVSVWTNMQGIMLTVFFFKLHWYDERYLSTHVYY